MQSGPAQLRDWMRRRGFNQNETAAYLGFDFPFISQLLNRRRNPGLTRSVIIERKTGIPVEAWLQSDMLGEMDPPRAEASDKQPVANR